MASSFFYVFANSTDGDDDTFNEWYDTQHVPDVLKVPGVVAAQRYALAPLEIPQGDDLPAQLPPPAHRYLVVYELDREPNAVMAEFLTRVGTEKMPLSETMDMSTVSMTAWQTHGKRQVAE